MRKGLSQTLYLVVVAVVLLIVALVLLTIFNIGIGPVGGLTEARNNCNLQGKSSCQATGVLPINWEFETIVNPDYPTVTGSKAFTSCDSLTTTHDCSKWLTKPA
ncbi:MAG: hypothetical protein ABIF08_00560 [Nanoarchaeota archaeon]